MQCICTHRLLVWRSHSPAVPVLRHALCNVTRECQASRASVPLPILIMNTMAYLQALGSCVEKR